MKYTIVRRYAAEETKFDFAVKIADALSAVAVWLEDEDLKCVEIWDDDVLILNYERE